MSSRIPRNAVQRHAERNVESVQHEIVQEKAATLQRIGKRLDDALKALADFDASPAPGGAGERDALVDRAGEALWFYVIQREVIGLRDTEAVIEELGVPREVQLRMGVLKPRSS